MTINITPTPQVLLALTNTPLKPLDAICELIDNGIDAFRSAILSGERVDSPWIQITVPGQSEVSRGLGVIRIADNGAGLDEAALEKALTAGFSSQNQFDSLGLFGMGFNIASGKLGMKTVVTTTRRGDDFAIRTTVDLPSLVSAGSFELETHRVEKPHDLESGTIVEISGWWPEGSQNAGFVKQLAQVSKPKLASQIGRRYSAILRRSDENRVSILLNGDQIRGFEHCVWDESRFVERQGWGRIPAKITFDEVLHTQRHCKRDRARIPDGAEKCAQCGSADFRTVDERVRGWVGIQRFDDADKFGIDVIRNGRAILVAEKDAFFSLYDDVGTRSREYPVDGLYGRIVGEIHIDHVPVDFTKQDFQRASDSWIRALDFIRGKSLLESKWEGDYKNESPVGRLFKGYRKVRRVGREDMYMAKWDDSRQGYVRAARETERDYFEKFEQRVPGYYDDANWWKLVEIAASPPLKGLSACPECQYQNSDSDEECVDCGTLLKAKDCLACGEAIPVSAVNCGLCGVSQVPEVDQPWRCALCNHENHVEEEHCSECGSLRGTLNPLSPEALATKSELDALLSFSKRTFNLGDGSTSMPVALRVFNVPSGSLVPGFAKPSLATFALKPRVGEVEIYLDRSHEVFKQLGALPELLLASEVAEYLHSLNGGVKGYSIASTSAMILKEVWGDSLLRDNEALASGIHDLIAEICQSLLKHPEVSDFYEELTDLELTDMTARLIKNDLLNSLDELRTSGRYLAYVQPTAISRFFSRYGESWFGIVWDDELPAHSSVGSSAILLARALKTRSYQRALDDCVDYLENSQVDENQALRVSSSLKYLQGKIL